MKAPIFRLAFVLLFGGLWAGAHEIGTTRVSATFDESRTFDIEMVTDASSLNEKLTAFSGSGAAPPTDAAHLQASLQSFDNLFRQRVKIVFDGVETRPAISYSVVPAVDSTSVPAATIRFTGEVPPGAGKFSWSFGWTFASYALTVRSALAANPAIEWLESGQASTPFSITAAAIQLSRWRTALRYLALGFTHIVPLGFDHVLFVLGIYLLSRRARSVLLQVSAFTLAHSITLGLSMYGIVSASPRVVEPLIALSIVYVAIENIFLSELKSWRLALVFAFGLLHGMGFAGALRELGLPRTEFVTALLTFNIGVEAGQLAVIGTAFLLVGWQWSERDWYRNRVVVPISMLIACTAVYWTFERLHFG